MRLIKNFTKESKALYYRLDFANNKSTNEILDHISTQLLKEKILLWEARGEYFSEGFISKNSMEISNDKVFLVFVKALESFENKIKSLAMSDRAQQVSSLNKDIGKIDVNDLK